MKILLMILHFPPAHMGGAEKQCWEQARTLAARGHDVTVLTEWWVGRSPKNELKEGVRIVRLGALLPLVAFTRRLHDRLIAGRRFRQAGEQIPALGFQNPAVAPSGEPQRKPFRLMAPVEWVGQLSFILAVVWAVMTRKLSADVVHVHETHWLAGFAHWVAERLHAPIVCTEHSPREALEWPGMRDVPGLSRWERRRKNGRFISISRRTRRSLEAQGIPPAQIADVYNGVVIPDRTARVENQNEIVYVGNFTQGAAHKAFDVLLQAWGRVHAQEPAARLRIYGGGDVAPWKRVAQENGCGDSVAFEGKTDHVVDKLLAAGIFVLPSRWEGLSVALLEAQAAGLPAVVSDIEGNVEIVEHGVNGLVVPVGEAEALAQAILQLYRDPDLRRRLGLAARAEAVHRFAIEKIAERLEQVYGQVLAKSPRQSPPDHFHN